MDKIVGIDLGTTNSLVAVVDSGIPLVLAWLCSFWRRWRNYERWNP